MVSALKVCFTLLTMLVLSFLPKDTLAEWTGDLIPPSCSISFNPTGSTNIGNLVTVTVNASDSGGSGVASITLKKNGVDEKTLPNSNTLTYSWNTNDQAVGTHNFSVTASDVAGNKRESACTNVFNLTSPPPPPPPLSVSCSGNPNPTYTNYVVTWTANPSGGTGTYSYVWSITDGWGGYGLQIYTQHSSNGQKTANLTVRSGAQSKTATCAVIVNPPPKKPPQSFNINSRTTTSSCEAGRPYINLAWTQSTNALTYHVYRQRWDTSRSQWVTEYAGTSYGSLSYKDFGIEQSSPYYYYVIAYGIDNPPAFSGWSDITYSPNCNLPPADFSINPSPPTDFCSGNIPPFPVMTVSWERPPTGTTAVWYNVYRYSVNTNSYQGPLAQIYDPTTIFYDFSVTPGDRYSYAIVAVNPNAFPGYKVAANSYQDQTKPVRECDKVISGNVYYKGTTTSYTGVFTLNSADKITLTYRAGAGTYSLTVPPKPRGGRDYYDIYMYAPSGYEITSATYLTGQTCGPGSPPCIGILYGGLPVTYLQANPNLKVDYFIEQIPYTYPTPVYTYPTPVYTYPTPATPSSPPLSPGPSKPPYIQTEGGDVHSNKEIKGTLP